MGQVCADSAYEGERVDFVDGTVFRPREQYLTLATFVDEAPAVSDYTGMAIYYRSLQRRQVDYLTVRDYLWRWDTDWFWCSRAFGVQQPLVRRLWPRRYRRSDVYRRLVAFDRRHQAQRPGAPRLRGQPAEEHVVQDVEVPVDAVLEVPRLLPPRRRHRAGLAVPAAAALRTSRGRSTRWSPTSSTSTSASGPASRCSPARPTATTTG